MFKEYFVLNCEKITTWYTLCSVHNKMKIKQEDKIFERIFLFIAREWRIEMKRNIILYAIFITAIFFYPVFAHADKIGQYFAVNPLPAPFALLGIGSGLLIAAGLTKNLIKT
ncbi:MAG: hypothetical protein L3J69_00560 [Desulfobacula sp.]|nr:hypothetical protein [Desulfobacula sp.]